MRLTRRRRGRPFACRPRRTSFAAQLAIGQASVQGRAPPQATGERAGTTKWRARPRHRVPSLTARREPLEDGARCGGSRAKEAHGYTSTQPPTLDARPDCRGGRRGADRAAGQATAGNGGVRTAAVQLGEVLRRHLDHEEQRVFPLLERHLSRREWRRFLRTERRRRPPRERPEFLTWVLDDASDQDAAAVMTEMPPLARFAYRWVLRPRYNAQRRWRPT
jgi:hypothetical protein